GCGMATEEHVGTNLLTALVVDDDTFGRAGVVSFCLAEGGFGNVDQAETSGEAVAKALELRPDIVFLDIALSDGVSGLDIVSSLKDSLPKTRILIVSQNQDERIAMRAMEVGADGYLPKTSPQRDFSEAVAKVRDGMAYLPESLVQLVVRDL